MQRFFSVKEKENVLGFFSASKYSYYYTLTHVKEMIENGKEQPYFTYSNNDVQKIRINK